MRQSYAIFCFFTVVVASLFLGPANGIELGHLGKYNAKNVAARKLAKNEKVESIENDKIFWTAIGHNLLEEKLKSERQYGVAKNVIFFLGDGMSIATLAAARMYMGQSQNKSGESEMLSFEKFPFTGLSKTYCVDSQVADSACSATAYLTGVKGNIETIGVTGTVANRDCRASEMPANQVESSLRWAQRAGKRTGVVTNMRVTHATPAGAYASVAQREWECDADVARDTLAGQECQNEMTVDIARQLVERETGRNLNVIMGGGRAKFLPKEYYFGQRKDHRHLISEWLNISRPSGASKVYIADRFQLDSLNIGETDYLLGLFANSHMSYNQLADTTKEPNLVEMTETAIRVLSKGDQGYYLFVEGGNIDMAHHFNWAHMALNETVMFSRAVERARQMTSRTDTLIVVTADHAHSMTLNGYPSRGNDVLGHSMVADGDGMPYSTLSYANGPSAPMPDNSTLKRRNLTDDDTGDFLYRFPSMANMEWETHGGEDVAVFALGPWAHLFVGNYEQNFIPYAISYAAKMGPGAEHERKHDHQTSSAGSKFEFTVSLAICALVSIAIR